MTGTIEIGVRTHAAPDALEELITAAVVRVGPRIEAAAELLGWALRPGGDFMSTFARELPALCLSALLDIPIDDHGRLFDWADGAEVGVEDSRALDTYLGALVCRRRNRPGHDVVSRLAVDAADEAAAGALRALIIDGVGAARARLGLAIIDLAERPEAWRRLQAEPGSVDGVVDGLAGPRVGVGAALIREELRVALRVLARQLDGLEIVGEPNVRERDGVDVPTSLHLCFRRRPES